MTPAKLDITIEQNATFSRVFRLSGPDGTPIDMTDHEVAAEIWAEGKTKLLATFAVAWGNRAEGEFTLSLPYSVTSELGVGGWWDLLVTNPDGTRDYWLRGRVTLAPGFTE